MDTTNTPLPDAPITDKTPEKKSADQAVTDEQLSEPVSHPLSSSKPSGIKGWLTKYWQHKKWTLPLTILVVVVLVMAVPVSRYKVLGLFIKENFSVALTDSVTNTPISKASVRLGGVSALTDAHGKATLKVPVGNGSLKVSKQYYTTTTQHVLVSLSNSHNALALQLVATGRQVPISVMNKITNKGVAGAEIKVLNTDAKTDQNGQAVIVLPTNAASQSATITANGFNTVTSTVQVTDKVVTANTFTLTSAGKVYFLSKLSGKIDVVKTNLDGTDRQTVLAGTGHEADTGTVLLASRDWKYLALLTQRDAAGTPEVDLIDTSNDTMTNIDKGNASFTLVGWDNNQFVYLVYRTNVQDWQPNKQALKSFNAASKSLILLDQTPGSGTGQSDYLRQSLGDAYIFNNEIVYSMDWFASNNANEISQLQSKTAVLNSVQPDGTGKKTIKSFGVGSATQANQLNLTLQSYSSPNTLAVAFSNPATGTDDNYIYINGQITATAQLSEPNIYAVTYPTFLVSPSGSQTFWSDPRDGKNTLFVGDQAGKNSTQVATLSDYDTYGWYSDSYLLVSKSGSELYIMPATGGSALKITDYHKPAQSFNGYGGGYGGR